MIIFFQLNYVALFLFLIASISDYFDGMLARAYNLESKLGAILDPIADKILVLFLLLAIVVTVKDPFVAFMSSLILAREFWISALREYASQDSNVSATKVTYLAKIKTSLQFSSISLYLASFATGNSLLLFVSHFFLFLTVLITFQTAIDYTKKFFMN